MAKLYSTSFILLVLLLLAAVESGVCQGEPQQCVTTWDCPGEERAGDKACKAKCSSSYAGGYGFCRPQNFNQPSQRFCVCSYKCPP